MGHQPFKLKMNLFCWFVLPFAVFLFCFLPADPRQLVIVLLAAVLISISVTAVSFLHFWFSGWYARFLEPKQKVALQNKEEKWVGFTIPTIRWCSLCVEVPIAILCLAFAFLMLISPLISNDFSAGSLIVACWGIGGLPLAGWYLWYACYRVLFRFRYDDEQLEVFPKAFRWKNFEWSALTAMKESKTTASLVIVFDDLGSVRIPRECLGFDRLVSTIQGKLNDARTS